MKKTKNIILIIVAIIVVCAGIFVGIYFTRLQTISTIKKLTDYEDGYNLYSMTIKYDYSTQDIIDQKITDTESYVEAVIKEAFPLLPVKIEVPSYGCSAFRASNDSGEMIMGRNYDFKLDTSCMLVYCNPKDGYKSMGFAALDNIGADDATAGLSKKMACLTSPFLCNDGINEKGVSIAVLTLDSEPTDQNTEREKITTSLAIRLVLDHAATTQEAIELLEKYDMNASNGRDYHFFISDASGNSVVAEYDCDDPQRTLTITPIQAITNFYGMYMEKVAPNQKNGKYGLGRERYDRIMEIINDHDGILSEEDAWYILKKVSSDRDPENVTSNTQWSIIYNNSELTADVVIRRNWEDHSTFFLVTNE